jgi:hypothetical protein
MMDSLFSYGGRPKGAPHKTTRVLKEAIILAAELSKHSETHDLVGYIQYLADNRPELFVSLLGKLLPLQVRAKNEGNGPVNLINTIDSGELRKLWTVNNLPLPPAVKASVFDLQIDRTGNAASAVSDALATITARLRG